MGVVEAIVYKQTKYIAKQVLLTVRDELINCYVDSTVEINGELYRVAMITDKFLKTKYGVELTREIKLVEKKYY
jgi:hypothetical protein